MKIYTKKGDKGQTALIGGTRVPKSNARIEAYGTIDELNAFIGLLRSKSTIETQDALLEQIQNNLFIVGSCLAADPENNKMKLPVIEAADIQNLEQSIDQMDAELPTLKNFVLPGGNEANAIAHICRTICRRAERLAVRIDADELILAYLNRLSDWFFILSRYISFKTGSKEVLWKSK